MGYSIEPPKLIGVVSMGVPNDRSHVRTSPDAVIILGMFSNVNKKEALQLTDAKSPA